MINGNSVIGMLMAAMSIPRTTEIYCEIIILWTFFLTRLQRNDMAKPHLTARKQDGQTPI